MIITKTHQKMNYSCETGAITHADKKRQHKPAISLLYMAKK